MLPPAHQSSSQETPDPEEDAAETEEEADDPNSDDAEVEEEESTPVTTGPRRSARERKPRQFIPIERCNLAVHSEVTTYKEDVDSPDSEKWKEAMEVEMRSLQDHQVWYLEKLPPGKKAVGSKWVFKVKTGEEGKVERFKAMQTCRPRF